MTGDRGAQMAEARKLCGQWVRNMKLVGYDDGIIANALVSMFQALTLRNTESVMGWIATLAQMQLDAANVIAVERDNEDEVARLMLDQAMTLEEAIEEATAGGQVRVQVTDDDISRLMAEQGLTFIEAVERLAQERGL